MRAREKRRSYQSFQEINARIYKVLGIGQTGAEKYSEVQLKFRNGVILGSTWG